MEQKLKSKIEFKLDSLLLNKYKSFCDKNGYDMSKRLRLYIESEVITDNLYKEITIENIIYKPTIEITPIKIDGINFIGSKKSPNVFILNTNYDIQNGENISFFIDNVKISIKGIHIHKSIGDYKLIECAYWREDYFDSNLLI
jgi:hypothetical protein